MGIKKTVIRTALNLTRSLVTNGPTATLGSAVRTLRTHAHASGLLPQVRLSSKVKMAMGPRQSLPPQGRPPAYSTQAMPMGQAPLPPELLYTTPSTLRPGLSPQFPQASPFPMLQGGDVSHAGHPPPPPTLQTFSGTVPSHMPQLPPQPSAMSPQENPPMQPVAWQGRPPQATGRPPPVRRQTQGGVPHDPAPIQTRPPQAYTQPPLQMSPGPARSSAPQRRYSESMLPESRPHALETPRPARHFMPSHTEARAPDAPVNIVSDTMRQAGLSNAVSGDPTQGPAYGAPTQRPAPSRRHTMAAMPDPRPSATALPDIAKDEYAFWNDKSALPSEKATVARPRRHSEGDLRTRTHPVTGKVEIWKPESVDLDDGSFDQVLTNARVLKERVLRDWGIERKPGAKLEASKDLLDARCMDAALQGSSAVDLKGIDPDRYR